LIDHHKHHTTTIYIFPHAASWTCAHEKTVQQGVCPRERNRHIIYILPHAESWICTDEETVQQRVCSRERNRNVLRDNSAEEAAAKLSISNFGLVEQLA